MFPTANAGVARLAPEYRTKRMRYVVGAGLVLTHYLRETVFDHLSHPFMRQSRDGGQSIDWRQASRIAQMGSTLFDLRNEPGFPEICNRLRTRDLQSTYCELMSAGSFQLKGCAIIAREAAYVKTEDFDFAIENGDVFANVEVTGLRGPDFSEKTVANALHAKRTQLPREAPAIIVCVTPCEWNERVENLDEILTKAAQEFLRTTQRINWVLFATEEFREHDRENGTLVFTSFSVRGEHVRLPSQALDDPMRRLPPTHYWPRESGAIRICGVLGLVPGLIDWVVGRLGRASGAASTVCGISCL